MQRSARWRIGTSSVLRGVAALASGEAWVVGSLDRDTAPYRSTLVERYTCR